jgi:DNA helicase-2/ATP-dependent DNA helicase PcrA
VDLVNDYATLDGHYQHVRVSNKPKLVSYPQASGGVPILGMFRDDTATLADDLGNFIHGIFRGSGYRLPNGTDIQRATDGGDVGDCTVLCSSPAEYSSSGQPRLPFLLREALRSKPHPIEVFNPRGQDLTGISVIMRLGGLLLECLDPTSTLEGSTSGLDADVHHVFQAWRNSAIDYANSKKAPRGLAGFSTGWADRDPQRVGWRWPMSVPVLDLVYGLVHYFPELHDDPEGQVYLEVFTRQIGACEQVGKFKGRVVTDPSNGSLSDASIRELLRDFLGPIAGGTVKVNEELTQTFPRNRLSILSIHQAKGLEFPIVVVDVGSDFRSNHRAHQFKRFPAEGGLPHRMEDLMRPYSCLGPPTRSGKDRAFDDLYRQFFVSYSRPQEVLLLVGLTTTEPGGVVQNVATGWQRKNYCCWQGNVPYVKI